MGILDQLGIQNGFSDFIGANRGALTGFGTGLASGRTLSQGIALGTQGLGTGSQRDDAYATAQKAEAERLNQINKTAELVRSKGYDDLLPLIEAGQGGAALTEAFSRMKEQPAADGPFAGTGMDAQTSNILLRGDPSTADYAYAYSLATQPKMTLKETPEGLVPVYETPNLQGIRPPTYQGAMPAQSQQPIQQSPTVGMDNGLSPAIGQPAQSPGISTGSAIPGTVPKPTEAQSRLGNLSGNLLYDVPIILANYDGLSDIKSRTAGKLPGIGPAFQSDEYKNAAQALESGVVNIVYALSGAQASDAEKRNVAAGLTPTLFDGPEQIALKKGRLVQYVTNIANSSADPTKKQQAAELLKLLDQPQQATGGNVVDMGNGITIETLN